MDKLVVKIIVGVALLVLPISAVYVIFNYPVPSSRTSLYQDVRNSILNGNDRTGATAVSANLREKLANQSKIKKFESTEELAVWLENNSQTSPAYYGRGAMMMDMFGSTREGMALEKSMSLDSASAVEESAPASDGGGSDDFSRTNIQVEGVDEADIVKNDGEYIYAVAENDLYIIKAHPAAEAKVISKIAFKSRPQDIYIDKDRLVVFGQDDQIIGLPVYKTFRRHNSYTFFKVFDTSDKKNPKQVQDLDFEGSYFNSRLIGDYVYFLTSNYHYYIEGEPVLPRYLKNGQAVEEDIASEKCLRCPNVYYFDIPYPSSQFVSVAAININDADKAITRDMYLLPQGQNMFVSSSNIYVTYTKYVSEYDIYMEAAREIVFPLLSPKNREMIAKIEAVDNVILTEAEKKNKISAIISRYQDTLSDSERSDLDKKVEDRVKQKYQDISKELEKTVIHKIAIDKDKLEYKTAGEVTGSVLNQFSMDENKGYFRIATTKNRNWSNFIDEKHTESYSNLYVLDDDMKVVGAVEELAKGERIYSVRFMGDRAYLVTFKQTDPLFAIDLSNPKNPKVMGELKIPGFSNYLHPYDENTLIGIGKDTLEKESGAVLTKGLKLSLFDVSDIKNPKEIDNITLGDQGSDSIALNDHKAVLFSKEKSLLSIPATLVEGQRIWGGWNYSFNGALVFKVDKSGFELKGRIDHSDGGREGKVEPWYGYNYYDNSVKRILYIDDVLYTFSSKYLGMNKISDLEQVGRVDLKMEKNGDFEVVN